MTDYSHTLLEQEEQATYTHENVRLIWVTPDAEKLVAYMARVSNPKFQNKEDIAGLLKYCVKNQHWSIFEMVNACFEINTTRDIGRQILRHRSFSFQEFSQRYADVNQLVASPLRACRLQDETNRQSSIPTDDPSLNEWWAQAQTFVEQVALDKYRKALEYGIAKEQARVLLPEGLTPSRMYMNGNLRSWIHFVGLRSGNGTQWEHQEIAKQIGSICETIFPTVWNALK
jgi:thymidylate synthase (FAD)